MFIKHFFAPLLEAEKRVREYGGTDRWQRICIITELTIGAFALMGLVDLLQRSYYVFITAVIAALALYIGLRVGKGQGKSLPTELTCFFVFAFFFTGYLIFGSNQGLSVLWIVFVPFLYMTMFNVRLGLALSIYYLLLLFATFYGPLTFLLRYDYPPMMRIRFPLLYLVDCVISLYCVRRMVLDRSALILAQEQLQVISFVDVTTGL